MRFRRHLVNTVTVQCLSYVALNHTLRNLVYKVSKILYGNVSPGFVYEQPNFVTFLAQQMLNLIRNLTTWKYETVNLTHE